MRDIRTGAEVADLIGVETLHRLRDSPAYGPFVCWHCHGRGDANTEPATVIAELGPGDAYTERSTVIPESSEGTARIALAHAECARSQVVDTGAPGEPEVGPIAVGPGEAWPCRSLTAELPGPDRVLPLLLLDQRPELAGRGRPDEGVTRFYSTLLRMGLAPVTAIGEHLAAAVDSPAVAAAYATGSPPWVLPPAPGWRLELSARRSARLIAPDGSLVWGGTCGQPRPWRALITRTGRCAVFIGAVGLYPKSGARPFTWISALLDQAAQAGELAGGLVAAR